MSRRMRFVRSVLVYYALISLGAAATTVAIRYASNHEDHHSLVLVDAVENSYSGGSKAAVVLGDYRNLDRCNNALLEFQKAIRNNREVVGYCVRSR